MISKHIKEGGKLFDNYISLNLKDPTIRRGRNKTVDLLAIAAAAVAFTASLNLIALPHSLHASLLGTSLPQPRPFKTLS